MQPPRLALDEQAHPHPNSPHPVQQWLQITEPWPRTELTVDLHGGGIYGVAAATAAQQAAGDDRGALPGSLRSSLKGLLAELAEAGRGTVAVVATAEAGPDQPGWRLHLEADGTLHVPQLTVEPLRAEGIPEHLVPHLVELFAVAAAEDRQVPPAEDPRPWAADMDASGALLATGPLSPASDADPAYLPPPAPDVASELGSEQDAADQATQPAGVGERPNRGGHRLERSDRGRPTAGSEPAPSRPSSAWRWWGSKTPTSMRTWASGSSRPAPSAPWWGSSASRSSTLPANHRGTASPGTPKPLSTLPCIPAG